MIPLWQTLIEKLLGWPVFAFATLLLLRKPVSDLIDRIDLFRMKGGTGELEVSATAVKKQMEANTVSPKDPLGLASTAELPAPLPGDMEARRKQVMEFPGDFPLFLKQVEIIKSDLAAIQMPLNTPETTEVLIRHLAATQLLQRAETLYRLIFGSQIAVMRELNVVGSSNEARVRSMYESALRKAPRFYDGYSFENWIDFLLGQKVVVLEDGKYAITDFGREFLKFLDVARLPRKRF